MCNPVAKDKLLHEEDEDLPALLNQCREEGMPNFTRSLCELVQEDKVLEAVALDAAPTAKHCSRRSRASTRQERPTWRRG